MLIEIIGTGFTNKGAELMLHSIVQALRSNLPIAQLVKSPHTNDYEKRALLGLLQKIGFKKIGINFGYLTWRLFLNRLKNLD
jgi:hypothetical protein